MNLEDMYKVLFGASSVNGAAFAVVQRWFTECGIVDGQVLTEGHFIHSYERLGPNREALSMTEFIQLIGILTRETKQTVGDFLERFRAVRDDIVTEIQSAQAQAERARERAKEESEFIVD